MYRLRNSVFFISRRSISTEQFSGLVQGALDVLNTPDPNHKTRLARKVHREWYEKRLSSPLSIDQIQAALPTTPIRPSQPQLLPCSHIRDHKTYGVSVGVWLLHSIAHVEYNAIDLAFDMIVRWANCWEKNVSNKSQYSLPTKFYEDWLFVGNDEAKHQWLLLRRLEDIGSFYGALPAHNNLWIHATDTMNDLLGRLVVIPLVQEARGLDAHYRMVEKLVGSGDNESAMLVDLICSEETTHVEKGVNWFSYLCDKHSFDKELEFKTAIKKYVPGGELLPPFNVWAREQAGMNPEMYMSSAAKRNQMEVQPTNNCVKVSEKRHIYKNSTWLKNQLHQLDKE